jgi:hypothetical protein
MADSLSMASMAFGARRGARVAGHALRALRGSAPRTSHKRRTKHRAPRRGGGSRGIRLSNDFVKAIILMNLARGMSHG